MIYWNQKHSPNIFTGKKQMARKSRWSLTGWMRPRIATSNSFSAAGIVGGIGIPQ